MDSTLCICTNLNLSEVPLTALRLKTRQMLSDLLNPERVIPNDKGYPRDWRGLHELATLPVLLSMGDDPTAKVLQMWIKDASSKGQSIPSLMDLTNFLEELDRWDVIDDIAEMLNADAEEYVSCKTQCLVKEVDQDADNQILTRDDIPRVSSGLPAQNYDAFLLYANEDEEFAVQMIQKLEEEYRLKLCVKERDLIGGFFEHEAIMRLIAERCNRLIVILSPNFLNSEANRFFVTYAQALGIEQRQRKVVPCLYQRCRIPSQLSHCFLLDYNRSGKLFNFWEKLKDSVEAHHAPNSLPPSVSVFPSSIGYSSAQFRNDRVRCTVEEVTDAEPSPIGQTAVVCLSDPSTLYPPFKIDDNSSADEWHPSKSKTTCIDSLPFQQLPKPESSSFMGKLLSKELSVKNIKPKKKWFSKKKAIALDDS